MPLAGPCQCGPERVAKALFRDLPNLFRMHAGLSGPDASAKNAPVAQLDRAPDYEFGGQEFESLRARHFGTKTGTPNIADFELEAATSVRRSTLFGADRQSRSTGLDVVGDDLPVARRAVALRLAALIRADRTQEDGKQTATKVAVRHTSRLTCADWSASQACNGSWHGRNHHNFNEHPRSPKVGREASPRRRVCRIDPLVPNRIVIFEQTHVSDPDLGA